jgi:hypothetical protein
VLIHVEIDLTAADVEKFEAYEARVLGLLGDYGAALQARYRSLDGSREFHLLRFPDEAALEAYRNDPVRLAVQPLWAECGASVVSREVRAIP